MYGVKLHPVLAPLLVETGVLDDEPLALIDVGASGGIGSWWSDFQPYLRAWGFDPIVQEVERLRASAPPGVKYVNAFVGCPDKQHLFPDLSTVDIALKDNRSLPRWSCTRALEVANKNFAQDMYNAGEEIRVATERVALDEFVARERIRNVDFGKSDTDSYDYQVLMGASTMLDSCRVLGVTVEANFHGPIHPHAGGFIHIDGFLRDAGFTLFDLTLHRYSRSALPGEFMYAHPSSTKTGPVMWADLLYFRDVGDPHYEAMWAENPSTTKLFKMIALLETFGLDDCAVEVMNKYWNQLSPYADLRDWRDRLVPGSKKRPRSYEMFIAQFEEQARSWRRNAGSGG